MKKTLLTLILLAFSDFAFSDCESLPEEADLGIIWSECDSCRTNADFAHAAEGDWTHGLDGVQVGFGVVVYQLENKYVMAVIAVSSSGEISAFMSDVSESPNGESCIDPESAGSGGTGGDNGGGGFGGGGFGGLGGLNLRCNEWTDYFDGQVSWTECTGWTSAQ